MDDTSKPLDPALGLQFLSVSDPAVRDNVMRYILAYRIMLTGQKDDSDDLKVMIGAGFGVSDETEASYQLRTRLDGCDRLYLRFDVDDAMGPPDGLGLFRREGDAVPLYGQCRLWSPLGGGRPAIVFLHEGQFGHFVYRPGRTLSRVDRLPSENVSHGFLRADARLAKLVSSERLRKVGELYVFLTT